MGSLYRPKYAPAGWKFRDAKAASVLRESEVWWIKYRNALGVLCRESTETTKEQEAKRILRRKEGAAESGRVEAPRASKITVAELATALTADYTANGRRSLDRLELSLAHLLPFFGPQRALQVTSTRVTEYKVARQAAGAAAATINRELSALRRMFSLAVKAERLQHRPHIAMLREDNARKGFFEEHQARAVRAKLPKHLQPVVDFAYITGWRIRSEILPLTWSRVDFKANVIRLDVGTTKSGEGREFVMTPALRATLEAQRATTEAVQKKYGIIIPLVFHRHLWTKKGQLVGHGHPIKSFYKAWKTACRAAGCPGRIVHDFRRTAVRNLERAGVPRSTAMRMVGHRTMEIYDRYAITDHAMLQEGSAKLAAYLEGTVPTLPAGLGKVQGTVAVLGAELADPVSANPAISRG